MENLFTKGKIEDIKQRRRFHSWLHPKIWKLCVMQDYVNNMDVMFFVALNMKQMLGELGKTTFEPFKEE